MQEILVLLQKYYVILILSLVIIGIIHMLTFGKYKKKFEKLENQIADDEKLGKSIVNKAQRQAFWEKQKAESELRAIRCRADELSTKISIIEADLKRRQDDYIAADKRASEIELKIQNSEKRLETINNRYKNNKFIIESVLSAVENYQKNSETLSQPLLERVNEAFELEFSDDLKALTIKDLRLRIKQLEKQIKACFKSYEAQYTTKQNKTIYLLIVMLLEEGVKNIYHGLAYGKLEKSTIAFNKLLDKLIKLASFADQTIVPTMTRFMGQLQFLYTEYLKTEYEYYVKFERAKEEQRALREQMRLEAEEMRILEAQKKSLENESKKYENEIQRIQEELKLSSENSKIAKLQARLQELERLLYEVDSKKTEVLKLQNGKAGTVYIISNLGSFGDKMFKVGMTRRLEPMDRVKELGDASVPFPFDVHSFIFSEDAVALESKLHRLLKEKRVNKINLRKEFFNTTIDELENLVNEIEPSAPFERTMLAEQFFKSQSVNYLPDEIDLNINYDENSTNDSDEYDITNEV